MSLKQEAVKGVVWSAVQKYGVRIITFFVTLILARLLVPEDFGLVAYATVFFTFAGMLVDQGFSDAIVQFPNLEREHLDTAFWISILTGTTLTLVSLAAANLIAALFHEPRLGPIIRWLSPNFIFGALNSVQYSILRRKLAFKSLTVRSLISVIASGIVGVIMAFLGYGVWSLVGKSLVAGAVSVITLWNVSNWRPSFHFSPKHFKELFSYGVNILGGNLVDFLSTNADNFLIGYFLGTTALGYYSLAYNLLITLTDLLVTVPNVVSFPIFSRIQNDPDRLKSAFYEVTQLQSLLAFPVFLGLFAVSPEAVRVLYGEKWAASIPVLQILMFSGITRSATFFYSSVFRASGKPSWRFGIYTLTAVLNVIGFLIVIRMGIVAVATSYVVVSYVLMPLFFFLIQKLVNVTIQGHLKQYATAFVSSLIMIAVVLLVKHFLGENIPVSIRFAILVIAGGVTYLLAIRFIKPELYAKMLELAQLAMPKSWREKISDRIKGMHLQIL
jgi:O-antigen/teichoic acid export membrane protein